MILNRDSVENIRKLIAGNGVSGTKGAVLVKPVDNACVYKGESVLIVKGSGVGIGNSDGIVDG